MMKKRLYIKAIGRCDPMSCPSCKIGHVHGKVYSATKCLQTGIYIATGSKEIPTKKQEIELWMRHTQFPSFCPLIEVDE